MSRPVPRRAVPPPPDADLEWWDVPDDGPPHTITAAGPVRLRVGHGGAAAGSSATALTRLDPGRPDRLPTPAGRRAALAAPRRLTPGRVRPPAEPGGPAGGRWPGWPLQALLVGFPLWWALGLSNFVFPLLAVPMALQLRRRAVVRYPPLFWLWALFMLWQVLSLAMFSASPPGTHPGATTAGRLLSAALSFVQFGGVSVVLVYVGNLSIVEVPQRVIARWMGWFFLTVVAGGFLGVLAPHFSFRSPVEMLLPARVAHDIYVRSLVHPIAAQVQNVLGTAKGRPAAPFGYTNSWGNVLGILIIWFVAGWVLPARPRARLMYSLVVVAAFVPIVVSLNRGLWLGLGATVVFVGFRQLVRGRADLISGAAALLVLAGVAVAVTPLHATVAHRLENGRSNSIRTFVAQQSITAIEHSPVLGYGGTRHTNGSSNSIAVGKTANCAQCGDVATGSTGSLWAVMFNQGLGGVVLYFGFFAGSLWIYRRERTPIDEAALATIFLVFVFMFFYNAVPVAPSLTMIAVAVLWRSRVVRCDQLQRTAPPPGAA